MKELGGPETGDGVEGGTQEGGRVSGASLEELMSRDDEESPTVSGMKCWHGEVEVEDRWGISSPTPRSEPDRPSGPLRKSKSRQHRGSSRSLRRAGRRIFSCFRRSTITLMVPDLEPSTPPKSGPLTGPKSGPVNAPRKSSGGAHGVTFLHEAADHHHHHVDREEDLGSEEPTSPVVNCMGQVRPCQQKRSKKVIEAAPAERERNLDDDREKFRRTKSQAPPRSPTTVSKSKSCKWKQLLRSNSSSISPSTHPMCGSEQGEPEIDLGRFSSASASADPSYRQAAAGSASHAQKPPDRTCLLLMRRNSKPSHQENHGSSVINNAPKLSQEQELGARDHDSGDGEDDEHRKAAAETPEPVLRNLPTSKPLKSVESPKWFADEPLVTNKRQGLWKSARMNSQTRTMCS